MGLSSFKFWLNCLRLYSSTTRPSLLECSSTYQIANQCRGPRHRMHHGWFWLDFFLYILTMMMVMYYYDMFRTVSYFYDIFVHFVLFLALYFYHVIYYLVHFIFMNLQLDEKEWNFLFKMYKTCSNVGKKGRRKLLEIEPSTQRQLTTADFSGS